MTLDLAFDSVGEGPPLLILHGLFGSGRNWRRVAGELARSYRVLTVDLRNHGASPWARAMDYPDMAGDVVRLIERQGLRRASVIGHSMGGKVAMALALLHPQRIDRLVVVDVAPVTYADRLSLFAEAMRAIDTLHAASRDEVRQRLAQQVGDPNVVAFLMQNLVARNAHFDWRINLAAIAPSIPVLSGFPPALRELRFRRPLHAIVGGRSDYVARADPTAFLPMFSQVRVEVIESAGHWVHAEQPEAFVAAARRALHGAALAAA